MASLSRVSTLLVFTAAFCPSALLAAALHPPLSPADAAAQVDAAISSAGREARVNVTRADFGAGCPGPADPTGRADSTCALRHAVEAAQRDTLHGAGYPVLYFPHGRYKVSSDGYTSALVLSTGISLVGDGAQSTVIENVSPHATTVTYKKAQDNCNNKPGPCLILIHGLTFAGGGHASTGGLIEIDSTHTGILSDVVLSNAGGIALNMQGSSERWIMSQSEIRDSRWSLVTEGDTNEDYFERVNILGPGQDDTQYCWSVNCPGGHIIPAGVWRPDSHAAVFLDGDNLHWMNSSIKDTTRMGGMRMAPTTSSVEHTYIEGYPYGHQPRMNFAVELGGKMELGHLTGAIGVNDMLIPVDDAGWQPLYTNDPADAFLNGTHSYVNAYAIYPADYVPGSKDPSRSVPGITRGTFERIRVGAFAGDGNAHLLSRGQDNTRAVAWPTGSIIEQEPARGYGVSRIIENHLNSLDVDDTKYASGCSDTDQLDNWTSSPSRLCAEIIAGLVPDGYGVPFPNQQVSWYGFSLNIEDNSIYTSGPKQLESEGQGWIKVPVHADVTLKAGNPMLTRFADPATALNTYSNDNTRVQIISWGGKSALGRVHDLSANVEFSPDQRYYSADVVVDGGVSHQYIGDPCWYDGTHTSRFCLHATGATQERFNGGSWQPISSPPQRVALETAAPPVPVRYALRDWNPGTLAPRGQPGDCVRTTRSTGDTEMSPDPEATLIVNANPSPGANILFAGSVPRLNTVAVEACNQAPVAQTLPAGLTVVLTQFSALPLLQATTNGR